MSFFFASGGLLFLLDQWSKRIAQAHAGSDVISRGSFLRFRVSPHSRSIYRHMYARAALVLVWLAALLSATLLYGQGDWFQSRLTQSALGAAFGGAAGNLMDILRRRHVVDFIQVLRLPIFNLADIAIFSGLAVALLRRY